MDSWNRDTSILRTEGRRMDSITKLLSDRIADLERILDKRDAEIKLFTPNWDLLKATQESLREHMELIKQKDADLALWDGREKVLCDMLDKKDDTIKRLKIHLETCQDAYDRDIKEAQ